MKILAIPFYAILLCSSLCLKAQNLLSYGNSHVTKAEFLKAFKKNNAEQPLSEKALREYLELYTRFKLKVKAAYDLKMDTLPNQKAELVDFRRQIEQGFLTDDNSVKDLVSDAFNRSKKDIHLAHIFIAFNAAGQNSTITSPGDTSKAWQLVSTIYRELEKGADFGKLAATYSSDVSATSNKGDIGYVTVFTLPYSLENIVYTTPVGKFSKPFRSNTGYHIFKNLGERKAAGRMKVAQIVLAFPIDTSHNEKDLVKQRADSIYNALIKGAQFTDLVDRFSSDVNALTTHGEMPEFGVGSFDPAFENAIFDLDKDGAISKPIQTPAGYYIIKRISRIPVNEDLLNDSAMAMLKQQVRNDSRIETARKAMSQKIYRVTGFKKSSIPDSLLLSYAENIHFARKTKMPAGISEKTVFFSFPTQKIYLDDFIKNLQALRFTQNGQSIQKVLATYEEVMRRDYYRKHLEDYDADFASQLKEFKEGNLLFEIMQRNIWDKASNDSVGLKAFFDRKKTTYWWESSADAIIFTSADTTTATELKRKLQPNIKNWRTIVAPYEAKVQSDSGRFELTQLPMTPQTVPVVGQFTELFKNNGDNNTSFVYFIRPYAQRQARNFEDAKGFVLNDYQIYLEEKWISELKSKYPVKVDEAVFKSMVK